MKTHNQLLPTLILVLSGYFIALGPTSFAQQAKVQHDQVSVGFARESMAPAIISDTPFRRVLEASAMVISRGDLQVAVVSLDLIEMTVQASQDLEKSISKLTGIPASNILLHTTHTHASPWAARESKLFDDLDRVISKTIIAALTSSQPAQMRIGNTDVGKSLSFQRRGDAGADLGFQTFWYGYQYREGDSRPDAGALVTEMKSRWSGEVPNYNQPAEPVWFDGPVEPFVQVIAFDNLSGEPIGTITRFSSHIGPADAAKERKFDPDFPAVVRDHMEEQYGGVAMYLSGPLGDLAPKVQIDYVIDESKDIPGEYLGPTWALVAKDEHQAMAERDRIGKEIAEAALEGLIGSISQSISEFSFLNRRVATPLNPYLPTSLEGIETTKRTLLQEYYASQRAEGPLRELRALANSLNWLHWASQFVELISAEERAKGSIDLPISLIRLNGTGMLFLHSEITGKTSLDLKLAYPEVNLVSVCLTGGSMQYFPTAEMIDQGGYEGRATIVSRDAEEKLRTDVNQLMTELKLSPKE